MSRFALIALICVLLTTVGTAGIDIEGLINMRGDANNDQSVNISDLIFLSEYLFSGGDEPPCMNQADVNDDGTVNVSDPIYLNNWLFSAGSPPPHPGPDNPYCEDDITSPNPGCLDYVCS